jgi:hypothetical protein
MSYTLGEALYDVYEALGQITTFRCTSDGTTATVISANTNYTQNKLPGAILIKETTDDAAPVGEFSEVSSFAPGTGTFTVSPVFTAATTNLDIFGYAAPSYPLFTVINLINDALRVLGDIDLVDTTTLDTAANKTEYAYSATWKRRPPTRVDIQTKTDDANDNRWKTIYDWRYIPAAAGTDGLIVFGEQPQSVRDLRVSYEDRHPRVSAYNDVIYEAIHPNVLVAQAAERAYAWNFNKTRDKNLVPSWNEAKATLREALENNPIFRIEHEPNIKMYTNPAGGLVQEWSDDPNTIRL